jgi:ATP-dependent Clp protease ATP-binding subunit ClpA
VKNWVFSRNCFFKVCFFKYNLYRYDEVGESQEAVGAAPGAAGAAGGSKTPTLEEFGSDLTKQAEEAKLDPCIGRANEIVRVTQILGRRTKNNPCLIGEPGVGKSAIAEGLVGLYNLNPAYP